MIDKGFYYVNYSFSTFLVDGLKGQKPIVQGNALGK